MSLSTNSRFRFTVSVRRIDIQGRIVEPLHFDIRPRLVRKNSADNREIVPSSSDTWSRIAWRTLGDGRLYWIIADMSNVVDPFADLHPKETLDFLTQLSAGLGAGTQTQITTSDPRRVTRGMKLRIEDLDPANLISVDVVVLTTNLTTGVVTFSPTDVPAPGIPSALSRVSRLALEDVRLTTPSISRAVFESLDFNDPLQTLVD